MLLSRSSCPLRRLHLWVHICEHDLIQCLEHTTATLEELDVEGVYEQTRITNRFFELLTVQPDREILCPLLKFVRLVTCDTASYGCSDPITYPSRY